MKNKTRIPLESDVAMRSPISRSARLGYDPYNHVSRSESMNLADVEDQLWSRSGQLKRSVDRGSAT